jgi:hypothetical protein
MNTTQTAADAYLTKVEHIGEQIATLDALLAMHAQRQAADPRNWGYAGDLSGVIGQLKAAIEMLGGESA